MQFVFCILFFNQFDALEKVFSKCFNNLDVSFQIYDHYEGGGKVVNAQNYVFYFESDIANAFAFRPTCSSYDYERENKSKGEPKRTRNGSEQMWQTWINRMGGL